MTPTQRTTHATVRLRPPVGSGYGVSSGYGALQSAVTSTSASSTGASLRTTHVSGTAIGLAQAHTQSGLSGARGRRGRDQGRQNVATATAGFSGTAVTQVAVAGTGAPRLSDDFTAGKHCTSAGAFADELSTPRSRALVTSVAVVVSDEEHADMYSGDTVTLPYLEKCVDGSRVNGVE